MREQAARRDEGRTPRRVSFVAPAAFAGLVALLLSACEPARPPAAAPDDPASQAAGSPTEPVPGEAETTAVSPTAPTQEAESVLGFGAEERPLEYAAHRVGSAACATCHPEQEATRATHHMARTGEFVSPVNRAAWFDLERLGHTVEWPDASTRPPAYHHEGDATFLTVQEQSGKTHQAQVGAVFGSGFRGFTPVALAPKRGLRELRLSYFREAAHWVMTPGSKDDPDPLGYARSSETSEDCLRCHSTSLVWKDDLLDSERSVLGIQCERCHGPGSAHVDAVNSVAGTASIFNPGHLRGRAQVEFCSECHRGPANAEPHTVLLRLPRLARHAGLGLQLSACFLRSPPAETITCLDCHDPHRNIKHGEENYNASCLRCHPAPEAVHRNAVKREDDCVGCHMPVEKRGFFGLSFTDHWIRVPEAPPPWKTEKKDVYVELLDRAYRQAISGARVAPERAAKLRMRLGKLLVRSGRTDEGLTWLREALTFEPLYKDRILSAEYHRDSGRGADARRLLEETIRKTPEHNRAYYTLAQLHLKAGELKLAAGVLDAWGKARPEDPFLTRSRRELTRRRLELQASQ